jgi:hypothetical protein
MEISKLCIQNEGYDLVSGAIPLKCGFEENQRVGLHVA